MNRIFAADFSEFKAVISFIKEGLFSLGLNDETINRAHVICDEFITNIIKNAYCDENADTLNINGTDYTKPLQISYYQRANTLSIEITDWGRQFNPVEYCQGLIDEENPGGFGIPIAKNLSDEIQYRREYHKNILTISINF